MIETLALLFAGAFLFGAGMATHHFLVRKVEPPTPKGEIIKIVGDDDVARAVSVAGITRTTYSDLKGDFVEPYNIAEFLKEKEGEELSIGDVIKDDDE